MSPVKALTLWSLWLGLLTCTAALAEPPPGLSKPSAPLRVEIALLGEFIPDQPLPLQVTLHSRVAVEELQLHITLHGDLHLLEGELTWHGPLLPNAAHTQSLLVRLPHGATGRVEATAGYHAGGSTQFSASHSLPLGDSAPPVPLSGVQESTQRPAAQWNGRPVIEYPLR